MAVRTMYYLPATDATRIDELLESVNVELEKLGYKKANRSVFIRALIFSADKLKPEDLIEGINKARTYA